MSLSRVSNSDFLRKGVGVTHRQPRLSEDLTASRGQNPGRGDFKLSQDSEMYLCAHIERIVFAVSKTSDPISALTPADSPFKPIYTTSDSGAFPRVTPKVEECVEDDIPVSVRKCFKELRSVKDELERQV
jgi:hypothetical protein